MDVVQSPHEIQSRVLFLRKSGQSVGLVPTMGALHDGHLSLIAAANRECDIVLTTIFVNPTQFAPNEDFERYPRPLQSDLQMCRKAGADIVFTPATDSMYPPESQTKVSVGKLTQVLEGACRPDHFDGVTTVVAKLLNISQPDAAFFGQKDYQQQLVIRQMVRDLNWPIRIVTCPTIRDPDGLAMSSRNRYLTVGQRKDALLLNRTLETAQQLADDPNKSPGEIQNMMLECLIAEKGMSVDYAVVVNSLTLEPLIERPDEAIALIAARVGKTRLIDNRILTFPPNG